MKLFTLAIVSLMASATLAMESYIEHPSVNGLKLNNACATEATFKSIKPIKVCVETKETKLACSDAGDAGEMCRTLKAGQKPTAFEYIKKEISCVKHGKKDMEVSRAYNETVCTKWEPSTEANHGACLEEVSIQKFAPTSYKAAWYTVHPESGPYFQGYKKFTVPNCN